MQPRISDRILALLIITAHLGIMHPALTYSEEKTSNFRFYRYTPNLNIYEQLTPSEESRGHLLFASINEIANSKKQLEIPPAPSISKMITASEGGIVRLGTAEVEIPAGALADDTV
ncbi:MAG: hypothetical protein LBU88_08585, partial [Treponema sp.]|nr:hypothetical protein [Treponema sp.]